MQIIRTAAMVQLLLGNIGRTGGGIMALRGHASIQGSTDIPTLFNILPGYIPMAHAHAKQTLAEFVEKNSSPTGRRRASRSSRGSRGPSWPPRRRRARSARSCRPTPRRSWQTRPFPPGTRPGASCHSSSPAARRQAAAACAMITPARTARPARRLAIVGAALELTAASVMERRLGFLAEPYKRGHAGALATAAKGLTAAGALTMLLQGRQRRGAVGAGALLLAGSVAERFAIFRAGLDSARDPRYTIIPQRQRVDRRAATTA